MLGTNLVVGNNTDNELIIELIIDSNNFSYQIGDLHNKFEDLKLPFTLEPEHTNKFASIKGKMVVNSEVKYKSWFIENPVSRDLNKRITLKLGPKIE